MSVEKPDFSVDGEAEELARQEAEGGEGEQEGAEAKAEGAAEGAPAAEATGATGAAGAPAAETEGATGIDGPAVPFQRWQRVNDKLSTTMQENERLKAQLDAATKAETAAPAAAAAPVDLKDLRKQYRAALYSGDDDTADKLEEQIQAEQDRRAAELAKQAEDRAYTRVKTETVAASVAETAAKLTAQYSFLDPNSADANAEAIAEVVALRDVYAARGDPLHVALEKAVKRIAPDYGGDVEQPTAGNTTDLRAERQRRALHAAADASNRQPPAINTTGAGTRNGVLELDGKTMTDEQIKEVSKDKAAMFGGKFGV